MLEVVWLLKNICDLVWKEIYGIFETKNPIKKQVNEYKMTKWEIRKKVTNLSDEELNTKINKKAYVKVVSWLLLLSDVEEKKQEV